MGSWQVGQVFVKERQLRKRESSLEKVLFFSLLSSASFTNLSLFKILDKIWCTSSDSSFSALARIGNVSLKHVNYTVLLFTYSSICVAFSNASIRDTRSKAPKLQSSKQTNKNTHMCQIHIQTLSQRGWNRSWSCDAALAVGRNPLIQFAVECLYGSTPAVLPILSTKCTFCFGNQRPVPDMLVPVMVNP